VQQLDAVIGAMRGIASAHAQQSRRLLPGFRAYADTITEAIASALRLRDRVPAARGTSPRHARVLFCAEQGFVGGFVEHLWDQVAKRPPADLLLVGSRGLSSAAAHNIVPVWHTPMATQVDGIAVLCIRIASALYGFIADRSLGVVEVVFPQWIAGEGLRVSARSLLPLDHQRFNATSAAVPPLSTLAPEVLLASLAEEYVYASLCEAAIHAFVAENEARAATMVRAHGNLQDMLTDLCLAEHRARQGAITGEVVELVGGSLASAG
jgi:F-type H+-transporting ATPase subunit gamma